ncbi:phasin family protein [Muricoccus vinaceus]|uniref:Phasin family protein n=1 Tax=Muricoccus vinaceus TaxID=424704 RepID=A0ABV6IYX1_9PROT
MMTMNSTQQATVAMDKLSRAAAGGAAFNRAYLDAATRSGQLWTAGLQDLGKRYIGAAQSMTEQFQATAKALSSARTMKEAAEIQAAHVRSVMEQAMSQATSFREATLQLVQQASAPMAEQAAATSATMMARAPQA